MLTPKTRFQLSEISGIYNIKQQVRSLFVSSIRNPWEWYLSLWSYGCDGKGGLRGRLTKRRLSRGTNAWKELYSDSCDPLLFRRWLKSLYNPDFKFDLGEGYSESAVSNIAGFYTYIYIKLCCANSQDIRNVKIDSIEDLEDFESNNCFISKWIRNGSLEQDFIEVLIMSGKEITREDENFIWMCKRTNVSKRHYTPSFYYDDETRELVRKKEEIIIRILLSWRVLSS